MFKSTITLHSGSVAQIESADVSKLIEVLAANLGVVTSIEVVNQSSSQEKEKVELVPTKTKKSYLTYKTSTDTAWSEKDILLIAEDLKRTGARHGTIQDTVRHVKLNGDSKRTEWSVYVMVNRVKQYMFNGKTRGTGLAKYAVSILRSHGFLPASQTIIKNGPVKPKKFIHWSDKDIAETGKIVRANIHLEKGLSNLVKDYIEKEGDTKARTDATIYTVVSDMKLYLSGKDDSRVGIRMKKALDNAGVYPVGHGESVPVKRFSDKSLLEA